MSNLSATTKSRWKTMVGDLFIGTAFVPTCVTDDTIDVQQVFPGVNRVAWATINGTANHSTINCDLGGTAKITLGTGSASGGGEILIIGTSQ